VVDVSIFCLIYRSTQYMDFMYRQVMEFTPSVREDWGTEFFFVLNDPTPEVERHARDMNYPFTVVNNVMHTNEELFAKGIGCPEYMNRVYAGYNMGIQLSKGKIVVMLCSDQCLSPDWLENLLKYLAPGTCITSMSIERDTTFPGTYYGQFGNHPNNLNKRGYLDRIKKLKTTGLVRKGAFMPLAMYRADAFKVGLFPEGNVAGRTFEDIPVECGDERFITNLRDRGIERYVSLDSVIYHIKEGERDE
jgi:hypothetical protein